MEHTLSPDASPADGDRRATMKRQKTAEPPPEEPLLDALVNRDEAAALALLTPDSTLDVNFRAAPLAGEPGRALPRDARAAPPRRARRRAGGRQRLHPADRGGVRRPYRGGRAAAALGRAAPRVRLVRHRRDRLGAGERQSRRRAPPRRQRARVLRLREEGLALGDDELPAAARRAPRGDPPRRVRPARGGGERARRRRRRRPPTPSSRPSPRTPRRCRSPPPRRGRLLRLAPPSPCPRGSASYFIITL